MKQQTETPIYATLLYGVLHKLDISVAEYFYLDMVYHLSKDGWCYKSLHNVAKDMNMNKMGVYKMRNRMLERGLLVKNIKGHVKTSVTYNKVILTDPKPYNLVSNRITKLYPSVSQSYTKNNNENNIDNKGKKSLNKERIRKAIESHNWDLLKQNATS